MTFTPPQRELVRSAVEETCARRAWPLHALVVESAHLHAVVAAPTTPEKALQDLKSWATRRLRAHGHLLDHPHVRAEHGSTGYLFEPHDVARAVAYVLDDHHVDARRAP